MSRKRRRQQGDSPVLAAPPTDLRQHEIRQQVTAISASYQGLLPPPEMLAQFNQIIPNGADRIVAIAESQVHHRQALESAVVNGNVTAQRRGQNYGFALGLIAIVGGIALIAFNKDTSGLVSIISAFTALASVFIYGRWQQHQEREQKRREAREALQQPRLPYDSN